MKPCFSCGYDSKEFYHEDPYNDRIGFYYCEGCMKETKKPIDPETFSKYLQENLLNNLEIELSSAGFKTVRKHPLADI